MPIRVSEHFSLPDLEDPSALGVDPDAHLDHLYEIFKIDFLQRAFLLRGLPVQTRRQPWTRGKPSSFWHVVSQGEIEEDRELCYRRCERIRWIRVMIEAIDSGHIMVWTELRPLGNRTATYYHLALPDFTYLVVIEKRADYWLLITAYPVLEDHSQRKLKRRFEAAQNTGS